MSITKISTGIIGTTGASDGDVLTFVSANGSVEFKAATGGSGSADLVESNLSSYASYANSTFATDTNLNTVSSNAATNASSITALNAEVDQLGSYANSTFATDTNLNTVQSNVTSVGGELDAFGTYANATFSTGSGNTQVYVGSTLVSNTAILLSAGDGINLAANTTSKTVTITTSMSNITSQIIGTDGSSNVFTISKAAANANMLLVSVNGLLLNPTEYTISSTTLTLSNTDPLIAGSNVEVRHFDFFQFGGVSASGGGGVSPEPFQGEVAGYNTNGNRPTGAIASIQKYSFTSDAGSVNIGNRTVAVYGSAGQSSSTHGYTAGGTAPSPGTVDTVDKFSFTSDSNSVDALELTSARIYGTGHSSTTNGYMTGEGGVPAAVATLDKFPFSSDTPATGIGVLTPSTPSYSNRAGVSSATDGYSVHALVMDKFPFSSDTDSTNIGSMGAPTTRTHGTAGQNSDTHGYASGFFTPPATYNNYISKFPFASDTNATSNIAALTLSRSRATGTSSTTHGYTAGGIVSPFPGHTPRIDKFTFSSDSPASTVGNLGLATEYASSQQY